MVFTQAKQGCKQTDNNKNINKGHAESFLLSIFDACRCEHRKPYLVNDSRVKNPGVRAALAFSGMTPWDERQTARGFTLIELLVVVLIIGILAAVALPQYQKAVEKSRSMKMLSLLKSVAQAAEVYHLANNEYPSSFDQLDISIPADFTGNTKFLNGVSDTISNEEWSLQILHEGGTGWELLLLGKITGPHIGAGFGYPLQVADRDKERFSSAQHKISCLETVSNGIIYPNTAGDFCEKIMNATYFDEGYHRFYVL